MPYETKTLAFLFLRARHMETAQPAAETAIPAEAPSSAAAAPDDGFTTVAGKRQRRQKDVGGTTQSPGDRAAAPPQRAAGAAPLFQLPKKWARAVRGRRENSSKLHVSFHATERDSGADWNTLSHAQLCLAAEAAFVSMLRVACSKSASIVSKTAEGLQGSLYTDCRVQLARDSSGKPFAATYTLGIEYPALLQPYVMTYLLTHDACLMLCLAGRKQPVPAQMHYPMPDDSMRAGPPCYLVAMRPDSLLEPEAIVDTFAEQPSGFQVHWAGKVMAPAADASGLVVGGLSWSPGVKKHLLGVPNAALHVPATVHAPWASGPLFPGAIVALVSGGQHLLPKKGSPGGFRLGTENDVDRPDGLRPEVRVLLSRVFNRAGRCAPLPGEAPRNPRNPWNTQPALAAAAAPAGIPAPAKSPPPATSLPSLPVPTPAGAAAAPDPLASSSSAQAPPPKPLQVTAVRPAVPVRSRSAGRGFKVTRGRSVSPIPLLDRIGDPFAGMPARQLSGYGKFKPNVKCARRSSPGRGGLDAADMDCDQSGGS